MVLLDQPTQIPQGNCTPIGGIQLYTKTMCQGVGMTLAEVLLQGQLSSLEYLKPQPQPARTTSPFMIDVIDLHPIMVRAHQPPRPCIEGGATGYQQAGLALRWGVPPLPLHIPNRWPYNQVWLLLNPELEGTYRNGTELAVLIEQGDKFAAALQSMSNAAIEPTRKAAIVAILQPEEI